MRDTRSQIVRAYHGARLAILAFLAGTLAAACGGGEPTAPFGVEGVYEATKFVVVVGQEEPIDVIAGGGELRIALAADGTTTGRLFVPPSLTGGEIMDASLDGTWARDAQLVNFDQAADTFVRDLSWTVAPPRIYVVDQVAGMGRFTITLMRQ